MECRSGEEVLMPARGTSALAYGILCHQEIKFTSFSAYTWYLAHFPELCVVSVPDPDLLD